MKPRCIGCRSLVKPGEPRTLTTHGTAHDDPACFAAWTRRHPAQTSPQTLQERP